jgi:hypothetical protein
MSNGVAQIRHGDVGAVALKQPINPILTTPATFGAVETKHVQLLGGSPSE